MSYVIDALVSLLVGGGLVFWAMKRREIKALADKTADVVREAVK